MASYALYRRRCRSPIGWFEVGEIELYEPDLIHQAIEKVAYELELPSELEFVLPVFHVSMLRKCIGDPSRVVPIKDVQVTEDLSSEEVPVAILDLTSSQAENKRCSFRQSIVEEQEYGRNYIGSRRRDEV
ncbi:uncharacterized protein [Nicotiana sylvestris]|uniref:uncharacterized protein n=1 Tax=Nicotiana sylvestris TaxID=4096 RepID=UPI00388CD959